MTNKECRISGKEFAVIDAFKVLGRTIMAIRFEEYTDKTHIILEYKLYPYSESQYLDITDLSKLYEREL